nr:MAG TPA: hypothetical protein [Caudoviricetes sp.]
MVNIPEHILHCFGVWHSPEVRFLRCVQIKSKSNI